VGEWRYVSTILISALDGGEWSVLISETVIILAYLLYSLQEVQLQKLKELQDYLYVNVRSSCTEDNLHTVNRKLLHRFTTQNVFRRPVFEIGSKGANRVGPFNLFI
jgi:hypothetical protein